VLVVGVASLSLSQSMLLSGKVIDASTHQPVVQAVVEVLELGKRKTTDEDGCFRYEQLAPGTYTLSVRHMAYAGADYRIDLPSHERDSLLIQLRPALFHSDEVVIRSTRASSVLSDIPYPVNIEMTDHLIQYSTVTVPDALNTVPGVALVRDGTWETALSIRGMSRSNIVSLIDNTRIETANDIAGALSLININDLERVELLKSAGSVLYGTGAFGGVLHLVTKRPSFTDQLRTNAELTGSASSVNGEMSQYAAVEGSSDRYAVRLSGGYRHAGNTSTPDGVLPHSQFHDFSLTGSLGLRTMGEQTLFLLYQRSQAEDTGIPGGSAFGVTAAVRYTLARRELLGIEYRIPNYSSRLPLMTFRLSRQEIDRNVEILQTPSLTVTPHAVHTTINAQMEFKIIPAVDHLLVLGAEAWERSLDSRREKNNRSINKIIGERPIPSSTFFSSGIYAQDEWRIMPDRLTMTMGARVDGIHVSNEKTFNPEYVVTAGTLRTNTADSTMLWDRGSANDKSWSAHAGFQARLTSEVDLTVLAATAFRSPSLEERYQYLDLGNGIVQVGNPNLQPERSICFNSGIRIHADGLNIRTDVFLNRMTNLVTTVPGSFEGRPALINANIGEAQLYGYEFSGETELTDWSVLKTSIAYVRGQDLRTHADLPQIAPIQGRLEWSSSVARIGTVSISCTGTGAQKNLAPGEIPTAGYAVVDFSLVSVPLNIDRFSIVVRSGIQNVLEKAYQNHLSTLRGLIKEEPGRNFFLSVSIAV